MARQRKGGSERARLSVVLVEPKYQGNIGAVARAMKNFDVGDLVVVTSVPLDDEAYQRAMHSKDILDGARAFKAIDEALSGFDYLVATSGESTRSDKKHLRKAMTPRELVDHIKNVKGRVGLLFGREDFGLFNEEIERCDALVTIPASTEYPVLNLSHAVTLILYELYLERAAVWRPPPSSGFEREKIMDLFSAYMETIEYPEHKRRKAAIMLKRIIGRADITKWEFHSLMGLFSKAINRINRLEGAGVRPRASRKVTRRAIGKKTVWRTAGKKATRRAAVKKATRKTAGKKAIRSTPHLKATSRVGMVKRRR